MPLRIGNASRSAWDGPVRSLVSTRSGLSARAAGGATSLPSRIGLLLIAAGIASCLIVARADASVRPFESIGPIEIGMSRQAAERILGRPEATAYRRALLRGVYVELQYRGPAWTIGFEGPQGAQRVVKIVYSGSRYRTRAGVGLGSRIRSIVREFPGARCEDRLFGSTGIRYVVVIDRLTERRVLFHVAYERVLRPPPGEVVSISIQKRLPHARPYARHACFPGWRGR